MKKTGITIIAVIMLMVCEAQKAEKNFSKGVEAAHQGQYEKAIAFYSKAIQQDKLFAEAWYNMALAKSTLRQLSDAVHDYSKAIEINPAMKRAYLNRGIDLKALGYTQAAITDYSKVIDIDSSYAAAWYNRGIAYYDSDDFEHAYHDFITSVSLDSSSTEAWYNLGLTCNRLHLDAKATLCFTKVVELEPQNWKARAACSIYSSDYKTAISDLKKAITVDANDCEAWSMLGLLLRGINESDSKNALAKAQSIGCRALERSIEILAKAGKTP